MWEHSRVESPGNILTERTELSKEVIDLSKVTDAEIIIRLFHSPCTLKGVVFAFNVILKEHAVEQHVWQQHNSGTENGLYGSDGHIEFKCLNQGEFCSSHHNSIQKKLLL